MMTKTVLLPNCGCFNGIPGIPVTSPKKAQIGHGIDEMLGLGLGERAQGIDGHATLRILSDQCFFGGHEELCERLGESTPQDHRFFKILGAKGRNE